MKKILNQLSKAQSNYKAAINKAEAEIEDKIDFDFYIMYQPSDGFVVVSDDTNAPLADCLLIIKEKGRLSYEDYRANRI